MPLTSALDRGWEVIKGLATRQCTSGAWSAARVGAGGGAGGGQRAGAVGVGQGGGHWAGAAVRQGGGLWQEPLSGREENAGQEEEAALRAGRRTLGRSCCRGWHSAVLLLADFQKREKSS